MTSPTTLIDLPKTHYMSYEYPTQFQSPEELLNFLFQNEGFCPSILTTLFASNQVDLLTELVCIILRRLDVQNSLGRNFVNKSEQNENLHLEQTNSQNDAQSSPQNHHPTQPSQSTPILSQSDLPSGTRYGELHTIAALGINMGRIPISDTYYGPLVALTGNPTGFCDAQKLRPELLDFFRILRSRTNWNEKDFKNAILGSELNIYKEYLEESHNMLSKAERHIMVCTMAYELAFYRPFIETARDSKKRSDMTEITLNDGAHKVTSTHEGLNQNLDLIKNNFRHKFHQFETVPTITALSTQQFDIESSVDEFLMWTGLHTLSTPYSTQLWQFLGTNIVLSWKYIISNIVTLIKHMSLSLNINFIFWTFQTFFPRFLYTQIPQNIVLETINSIHDTNTKLNAIKEDQFQELQSYLMQVKIPSEKTLEFLKTTHQTKLAQIESGSASYNFLLTTRALLIGSFIVSLNECNLEQFYFLELISNTNSEIQILEEMVNKFPQKNHNLQDDGNQDRNQEGNPHNSKTKLRSRSQSLRRMRLSNTPQSDHSSSDDMGEEDEQERLYLQPKGRLKQLREEQKRSPKKLSNLNKKSQRGRNSKSSSEDDDNDDDNNYNNNNNNNNDHGDNGPPEHNVYHAPTQTLNGKKIDFFSDQLNQKLISLTFFTKKHTYSCSIHQILYYAFRYNFTLPSHLIALYVCAVLYQNESIISQLSPYGVTSNSTLSQVDSSGTDPLLSYDLSQYQRALRGFMQGGGNNPHGNPLIFEIIPNDKNNTHQNKNKLSLPNLVNPNFPALKKNQHNIALEESQIIDSLFLLQFSVHAVKGYFKHVKTRYGTMDLCLRLLGKRALGLPLTRLIKMSKKNFPDLVFSPPLTTSPALSSTLDPNNDIKLDNSNENSEYANLQHFLIDIVTNNNRCNVPFLNFLLNIGCPFTLDTSKYHHNSNILVAIISSPMMIDSNKAASIDSILNFAFQRYKIIPNITIDIFYFLLQSNWALRDFLTLDSFKLLKLIYLQFLDKSSWEKRLAPAILQDPNENPNGQFDRADFGQSKHSSRNQPKNSSKSFDFSQASQTVISSLKFLFSIDLETNSNRIVISSSTLSRITKQRVLMLELYQYILPENSQFVQKFFTHPIVSSDKLLRESLLRPIFTIGSVQTLEYLLKLGYQLDPLDFSRLLSHSNRVLDYRDCINVFSVLNSFFIHAYILKAKNEAVNSIEFERIEGLEIEAFKKDTVLTRNLAGFHSLIKQRSARSIYDRSTLMAGFETMENMFLGMIEGSAHGKKFSNNDQLEDEEMMGYFRNVSNALNYVPHKPDGLEALSCEIERDQELATDRLNKIMEYSQQNDGKGLGLDGEKLKYLKKMIKMERAQRKKMKRKKESVEQFDDYNDEVDFNDDYSNNEDEDNDEDNDEDDEAEILKQLEALRKVEEHVYKLDPRVFEALNHFNFYLCPNPEHRSTLLEFILLFRKKMQNFYQHFIASLLFYRSMYSFQSPMIYQIFRSLLPHLDLFPAQISYIWVDKFRNFDVIQHFNYKYLTTCYLEDVMCSILRINPAQLRYLLTPPSDTIQLYAEQQRQKMLFEKNNSEKLNKNTAEMTPFEILESVIMVTQDNGQNDLVSMGQEERDRYRLQISELIEGLLICILIQRSKHHPQSLKPHAPVEYPQYCFDTFKLIFHFLKFIPLPTTTLYSNRVKSFNYKSSYNDEILQTLKPSPPAIRPQFLHLIMQTLPITNPSIFNDLLELYLVQNGQLFAPLHHFHSFLLPHFFSPTNFNIVYFRYVLDLMKRYGVKVSTFSDSLWRNLLLQAIQHVQLPHQNEMELIQLFFEFLQLHQQDVINFRQDYMNTINDPDIIDATKGNNTKQVFENKRKLKQKWCLKSFNHIQHFSQTTDISGSNFFFWLAGMGFSPRICLAIIMIADKFSFQQQQQQGGKSFSSLFDKALKGKLDNLNNLNNLNDFDKNKLDSESSNSMLPIAAPLLLHITSKALDNQTQPFNPASISNINQVLQTHQNQARSKQDEKTTEIIKSNDSKEDTDLYQQSGPGLPECPPDTPDYPRNRFNQGNTVNDHSTPTLPPIPLLPFDSLFSKDHSGRTILHHLVENTELTPNLLQLMSCGAVDPLSHYNFNNLYLSTSNQVVPYLSEIPKSLDMTKFAHLKDRTQGDKDEANKIIHNEHKKAVEMVEKGGKSGAHRNETNHEDEDDDEPNNPSVALILDSLIKLKENEPPTPTLLTLDTSISPVSVTNAQKATPNSAPHTSNLHQWEIYPTKMSDGYLLDTLKHLHAVQANNVIQNWVLGNGIDQKSQRFDNDNNCEDDFEDDFSATQFENLKLKIINNSNSLDETITPHLLPLYHRTIYGTEQPLLFWLSYIRYYSHTATHVEERTTYIESLQPNKKKHFLTYKKAILLRQLRHRFPLTLSSTPDEVQELIKLSHDWQLKKAKKNEEKYGEYKKDVKNGSKSQNRGDDDDAADDDDGRSDYDNDSDYDEDGEYDSIGLYGDSGVMNRGSYGRGSKKFHDKKNGGKMQRPPPGHKKMIKMQNKQRRAIVGLGAAVLGLAVAAVGWFWLTSTAHEDDEEIEPTGQVSTYKYTKEHDRMIKSKKKRF